MAYPPLVKYASENDYRQHFQTKYCKSFITTYDGISVRFTNSDFRHAFYESSGNMRKNIFSAERAQRIDWIAAALLDDKAEMYYGWDSHTKIVDYRRRVALVQGNYVVVIQIMKRGNAKFITSFLVSNAQTLLRIKLSPKWQ